MKTEEKIESLRTIGCVIHNLECIKQINGEFPYTISDHVKQIIESAATISKVLADSSIDTKVEISSDREAVQPIRSIHPIGEDVPF